MKKKLLVTMMAATLSLGMMACGSSADNQEIENAQEETVTETDAVEVEVPEAPADVADDPVIDVEENSEQPIDEEFQTAGDYQAFAQDIKDAVAAKNIEMLAGLAAYPVYVGSSANSEEGSVIETKDDFMALGVDAVITAELIEAMDAVDTTTLVEAKAGYTMMNGEEGPSITFKEVDGVLGIVGINY